MAFLAWSKQEKYTCTSTRWCWKYDQSVVLDGNPLDRVFSLNGNPLNEDDGNLLDEVVLDRICLDKLVK